MVMVMSKDFEGILEKVIRLDQLIRMRATGPPADLAKRMGISASTLYQYLSAMRRLFKAPVRYDKRQKSYFYNMPGRINVGFRAKAGEVSSLETLRKITPAGRRKKGV
jgi:predicted DNA-binding transcriptional regulator YafY